MAPFQAAAKEKETGQKSDEIDISGGEMKPSVLQKKASESSMGQKTKTVKIEGVPPEHTDKKKTNPLADSSSKSKSGGKKTSSGGKHKQRVPEPDSLDSDYWDVDDENEWGDEDEDFQDPLEEASPDVAAAANATLGVSKDAPPIDLIAKVRALILSEFPVVLETLPCGTNASPVLNRIFSAYVRGHAVAGAQAGGSSVGLDGYPVSISQFMLEVRHIFLLYKC